jgi:Gnt-I system high-affinity gluconate transporter
MNFIILLLCIVFLVVLVTWIKVNPFLSFLITAILAGVLFGMPLEKISKSVNTGIGDTLGSLVVVIVLGAMLGKLVAESGAAQRIASVMQNVFGERYLIWGMALTGLVVGIPLYYNVGFVLLIPIIFSVAYKYKLPLVYIGLPMLASLSVMHGFLPPHPSPLALIVQFDAEMTTTFFYGLLIAIPAVIIAGPLFSSTLKNISGTAVVVDYKKPLEDERMPGITNSLISSLLPVLVIAFCTVAIQIFDHGGIYNLLNFLREPNVAMLLTIIIASYTLGIRGGKKVPEIMAVYGDAVKDIAMILLVIGSAGILKQIFIDSGVSRDIADVLSTLNVHPLILAWIIAAVLRLALGSATIAGLTAAGIIHPLVMGSDVDANLIVLSIGAGSLFCSHVNDTAFWLFKEYFGLSMKDTFRSWTLMESIVSVVGLIGVLILN